MPVRRLPPDEVKARDLVALDMLSQGKSNALIIAATRKAFGQGVTHSRLAMLRRGDDPKAVPVVRKIRDITPRFVAQDTPLARRVEAILRRSYTFELYTDESGGWNMTVREFDGCFACGKTPELALASMQRVVRSWLAACLKCGHRVPEPKYRVSPSYAVPWSR